MSYGHENRRMTPGRIRTVQIRGHEIAGQTLEEYMVDRETVAPGRLRHPRVEWASIIGQAANQRQHASAHVRLPRFGGRTIADGSNRVRALTQLPLRN